MSDDSQNENAHLPRPTPIRSDSLSDPRHCEFSSWPSREGEVICSFIHYFYLNKPQYNFYNFQYNYNPMVSRVGPTCHIDNRLPTSPTIYISLQCRYKITMNNSPMSNMFTSMNIQIESMIDIVLLLEHPISLMY